MGRSLDWSSVQVTDLQKERFTARFGSGLSAFLEIRMTQTGLQLFIITSADPAKGPPGSMLEEGGRRERVDSARGGGGPDLCADSIQARISVERPVGKSVTTDKKSQIYAQRFIHMCSKIAPRDPPTITLQSLLIEQLKLFYFPLDPSKLFASFTELKHQSTIAHPLTNLMFSSSHFAAYRYTSNVCQVD